MPVAQILCRFFSSLAERKDVYDRMFAFERNVCSVNK